MARRFIRCGGKRAPIDSPIAQSSNPRPSSPEPVNVVSSIQGVRVRTIAFVAVALLLAGCETGEGWVPADDRMPQNAPIATQPPPPVPIAGAPRLAQSSPPVAIAPVAPAPVAARPMAPRPPVTTTVAPAPVKTVDAHCQAVAHQRASDARANGYSFEMESTVYDGTYQACVAWDTHHETGTPP